MITWMQRHKKYLVITIWISVIAFVGAGFVGWGSVDFNLSRANYVAKVGRFGISPKEFEAEFSRLFNMQNQLSDGTLSREAAYKMGLDKQAIALLIQQKLLINYAYDLGLRISDEQVARAIIEDSTFADEKGFSKDKYNQILKQVGLKKSSYEASIKNILMVQNTLDMFKHYEPSKDDLAMLNALLYSEDNVDLAVIDAKDITPNDEQINEYYKEHKDEYKSAQTYELATFTITPEGLSEDKIKSYWDENKFLYKGTDGKILDYEQAKSRAAVDANLAATSSEAKLAYIALKKGEKQFSSVKTVGEKDELLSFVQDHKEGVVTKPFMHEGSWVIAKIEKINKPKPLSLNEAKEQIVKDLKIALAKDDLEQSAKKELENFKATMHLGWLSKTKNTTTLSNEVYAQLLAVTSTGKLQGFMIHEDKAYVYKIIDQKLGDETDIKDGLKLAFAQQANGLITSELISRLGARYPIEVYYKGSEF